MQLHTDKKWSKPKNWFHRLFGGRERRSGLSKIKSYLHDHGIVYRIHHHPDIFSASELAESLHVIREAVAKVVIIRADRRYFMMVLPSHLHMNFHRLARLLKVGHVSLATEQELETLFPDCEVGAMPPFGNLYGLPVYVDVSLNQEPRIYFAAGTHRDVIELRYEDFGRLVNPHVGVFAARPMKRVA